MAGARSEFGSFYGHGYVSARPKKEPQTCAAGPNHHQRGMAVVKCVGGLGATRALIAKKGKRGL
jgi:hypothetical protein